MAGLLFLSCVLLISVAYAVPVANFANHEFEWTMDGTAIPVSYDLRKAFPDCMQPVSNQGQCGSSFLVEAVTDLSESMCINNNTNAVLSSEYVAACCSQCGSCQGTNDQAAYTYLTQTGTITQACWASSQQCGVQCKHYVASIFNLKSVQDIQTAIMTAGPVVAYVDATTFEFYTGGIMMCQGVTPQLDDVVTLIGWGVRGSTPYWIGENSWGTEWGENGYFQIEMGINACGIETVDLGVFWAR